MYAFKNKLTYDKAKVSDSQIFIYLSIRAGDSLKRLYIA